MRHTITIAAFTALGAAAANAQSHAAPEIKWGPTPAVFAAGAQMAVLHGDPSKAAEYTVRLKMPNGYKIAPHWHPTDENITVVSGAFKVGMGKTFDAKGMLTLPTGGFITAPAKEPHFAETKGETVVQVHGMGPFQLTYVNPADAPKATASK